MIIVPLCQIVWYRYENARRDRITETIGRQGSNDEADDTPSPDFTDKTDFEQEDTFRYVM